MPLLYKEYNGLGTDGRYVRTKVLHNNGFRKQIGTLAQSCPLAYKQIGQLPYKQSEIQKVVVALNECAGKTPDYQVQQERSRPEVNTVAGMGFTQYRLNDYWTDISDAHYKGQWQPMVGVGIVAYFPNTGKRVAFYGEALYRSSGSVFDYQDRYSVFTNFQQQIKINYLRLNTVGRVYIPIRSTRLFVQAGVANAFALSNKNQRVEKGFDIFDPTRTRTVPTYQNVSPWELGFLGGVGLNVWRFSVETRFDWGDGFSRYRYEFNSPMRAYSLLVSYALFR